MLDLLGVQMLVLNHKKEVYINITVKRQNINEKSLRKILITQNLQREKISQNHACINVSSLNLNLVVHTCL